MKKFFKVIKWFGIVLGSLLLLILIVPLIIPIPALKDIYPPAELADEESRFIEVNGLTVHYKQTGQGEPVIILLHGFGAYLFSWREVMQPLAEVGTVIAFDRPAFGLTERPLNGDWQGENPYSVAGQVDMLADLMDVINVEKAILIGNSAGGTIATAFALEYPERVIALVEVDAAIYSTDHTLPGWVRPFLYTPQAERIVPWMMRSIKTWGVDFLKQAWHYPALITNEILEGYQLPLHTENWDKALFELIRAPVAKSLTPRLNELTMPVLVVTGDDDRIVPTEQSIQLANDIAGAQLAVLSDCGHTPQEECPAQFLEAVLVFLDGLK